jgi:hypothetical protein
MTIALPFITHPAAFVPVGTVTTRQRRSWLGSFLTSVKAVLGGRAATRALPLSADLTCFRSPAPLAEKPCFETAATAASGVPPSFDSTSGLHRRIYSAVAKTMVVLRRAMLGAGAHRDPVLSIPSGDDHPESAAHLRQAHYLISPSACSRLTTPSSRPPARPGATSSPSTSTSIGHRDWAHVGQK